MSSIHDLGDDLLLMCHESLPLWAVLCSRLVSRRWRASASRDAIWQVLCTRHLPATTALLQVTKTMQLFGKFYKRPARSSAPEDLSDVYLVLTLTTGRRTRDAWHDEDDVWHDDEYEYEDVPLMLQLAAARPRDVGCSQRELEWMMPPACRGADRHQIRSRAYLWDARNEAVSFLPGESTPFRSASLQETPIMQRVSVDTPGSRVRVIDGPHKRNVDSYRSEGPTFRARLRFGAALANAHRLLKHPNTYLDVTFEGDHCCFRLGRPGDLDHIFCALPIIDRPSAGQPGLLKTLALLEWR